MLIDEKTFVFEPDEEGSYRVTNTSENLSAAKEVNIELLRAVAKKLAKLNN